MRIKLFYVCIVPCILVLGCHPRSTTDLLQNTTPTPSHHDSRPSTVVRIVTANLTTGSRQTYDDDRGARILKALDSDVVAIQEFNYGDNKQETIAQWVGSRFGTEFQFVREMNSQIPNGVISRFPILKKGEWNDTVAPNRDFAYAKIDLPGSIPAWVVSVHFLTRSAGERKLQAKEVIQHIKSNIPKNEFVILAGDLNTDTPTEECIDVLGEVFATKGPHPVDDVGRRGTNAQRDKTYDWVLFDHKLEQKAVPTIVKGKVYAHGLVFDSRVQKNIQEFTGVDANDAAAPNMQHMAVVRDINLTSP